MFTPSQSRAARGLLHWTQADLAEKDLQAAIRSALETAGVDMIPTNGGGPGVRLRAPD
jgi:hypothetical protein